MSTQTKPLDADKPLYRRDQVGNLMTGQVRLLTRSYRCCGTNSPQWLVAYSSATGDELFIVDPVSGEACSPTNYTRSLFCHAPEEQVQTEFFLNYYANTGERGSVLDIFDTREDADDGNIFGSRDLCVRLSLEKQPCGQWLANVREL